MTLAPHQLPLEALLSHLGSSTRGLSHAEVRERLRQEGPNRLAEAQAPAAIRRFAHHLLQRFALLLLTGAALAFLGEYFRPGEGMFPIGLALTAVVFLNAAFSFWQEMRVEHAMAAFHRMLSPRAHVLRDGIEAVVDATELVIGDIVLLAEGDRVPADARILEASTLKVDNSLLTGESEPQLRDTQLATGEKLRSRNLVFCGTTVTSGHGKAMVYATGNATEMGTIASVMRDTHRVETPIHRELKHFIRVITRIALLLGAVFFAAGWAIGNPFWANLVFAIGILVANVPEGLLPTVTLALAIAGRKMAKRNALLKNLESAETLGCTTVIGTDKTGTITCNRMQVTHLDLAGGEEEALQTMTLCNNACLAVGGTESKGDPTEIALLEYVEKRHPGAVDQLRGRHQRLHESPFESAARKMATVHGAGDACFATLKGAPEAVFPLVTGTDVASWQQRADQLARSGKRVLALARKPIVAGSDIHQQLAERDYEFLGLAAMYDPPRPGIQAAVARCGDAGIRIVMISGDHPLTVESVAREVGILTGEAIVCIGENVGKMGDAALRGLVTKKGVAFARVNPLDKLRIVTALQQAGEVVAVTGDGVNDAPALKRADIGVAMGASGTDVAREAADMVLMDDNFVTIVDAVEEGRIIYANIRRSIGYVLTSNVPEILPYIAFVLLALPLPIPVVLILAIDLGTDMLPAIGLASEPAEADVMRQPPRSRGTRLLSPRLLAESYLLWGLMEAAAGFAAYFYVLLSGGWRMGESMPVSDPLYLQATSAFFVAIIFCQVANVMIWRTSRQTLLSKGLLGNRPVLQGIVVEFLLLWLMVGTDAGHALFKTASPPLFAWLVPIPFAIAMLALSELKKLSRQKRQHAPLCPAAIAGR